MIDAGLLINVLIGIALLLFLILQLKLQAFIALLISSITVALLSGISPEGTIELVKKGMGGTLGFVAVVVGLGAMFGAILEHSDGAESLAAYLLKAFGEKRANVAMVLTGFLISIPVFFDVAFILLVPLVYALQRKTGRSLLFYAIPLLAGLAITHSFIPPTPGPVAVADILKADLGQVILFGFIVGIPTAIVTGPIFGSYIARKIFVAAPPLEGAEPATADGRDFPSPILIFCIIAVPIVLILTNTFLGSPLAEGAAIPSAITHTFQLIGSPFVALIIANLIAWYLLGIRRGYKRKELLDITTASLGPAGIILLLTGAGGVFKQVLVETGVGEMLANYFAEQNVSLLVFAYFSAVLVRVLQGSATVAMITAAGLTAPLLTADHGSASLALLVIAIASGASILSHVNDSGFWLVSKYLGMDEKQTFRSWSMMTTVLSLTSIAMVALLSLFLIRPNPNANVNQSSMKVAICQTNMSWTIEENLETILQQIEKADSADADLVVFTECAITGYHRKLPTQCGEEDLKNALAQVRTASQEAGLATLIGTPLREGPDKVYNAAVLLGAVEEEVIFQKVGITESEKQFFTPGNSRPVATVNGKRIGVVFCREILDGQELVEAYQGQKLDFVAWPSYIKWDGDPSEPDYITESDYQKVAEQLNTCLVNINAANSLNDEALRGLGGSKVISSEHKLSLKPDEPEMYILEI